MKGERGEGLLKYSTRFEITNLNLAPGWCLEGKKFTPLSGEDLNKLLVDVFMCRCGCEDVSVSVCEFM